LNVPRVQRFPLAVLPNPVVALTMAPWVPAIVDVSPDCAHPPAPDMDSAIHRASANVFCAAAAASGEGVDVTPSPEGIASA
jgi:hypothetical protein